MTKKLLLLALCSLLLALGFSAHAQQSAKIPRIGYLGGGSAELEKAWLDAFLQGLRDLGYFEGKSVVVERRYAAGRYDQLPHLAAELVRLKVDVILAASTPVAHAAKSTTPVIPIVMASPILLGPVWYPASLGPAETLRDSQIFTPT
jgi:putative ABC transport system substrate-binding protein